MSTSHRAPARTTLALATALCTAGALALFVTPAATAATPRVAVPAGVARVGVVAKVPAGARAVGALAASTTVHLAVALRPRDAAGLAAYATSVSTPGSHLHGRYLTPAGFAERFGPSRQTVAQVTADLEHLGLKVGAVSANRLLVPVTASAAAVERAFGVGLERFDVPQRSLKQAAGAVRDGWAATAAPALPRAIAGDVSSIVGLDNLVAPEALALRGSGARPASGSAARAAAAAAQAAADPTGAPKACPAAQSDAVANGGWTQDQIAHAYGLDGLYARGEYGQGETIDVFELEPFLKSDLATFEKCYFGSSRLDEISVVPVDGGASTGPGEGEAILDVENIAAIAPDAHIVVYEGPQNSFGSIYGSTDTYNAIVSQDRANVVTTSWGLCENALQDYAPGTQQVEGYLFEEAAAQGQTVFGPAGDSGSDDCAFDTPGPVAPDLSVDDPASQPFVVGVGGTTLTAATEPPSETVWNDGPEGGGGGGGISDTWASPPWQAHSNVPGVRNAYSENPADDFCSPGTSSLADPPCREVPDVTLEADEYRGPTFYTVGYGGWTTFGGTSSSTPTFAAIAADIASTTACSALADNPVNHLADPGFLAPALYQAASDPATYAASFNDVTSGTNDIYALGLGYPATKGYDLASGLGSPIVVGAKGQPGLAAAICAEVAAPPAAGHPAPTVTSIDPSFGSIGGSSEPIAIDGRGFVADEVVAVDFGSVPATNFAVVSSDLLEAEPPAALQPLGALATPAGPVDVTVTEVEGSHVATSEPGPAAVYDYVATSTGGAVPAVSAVGPYGGPVTGGNTVVVYGGGFVTGGPIASVTFGGVPASGVHVVNDFELTAVVPAETGSTTCATGTGFDPANACQTEVVVTGANGASATSTILPALTGPTTVSAQGIIPVPAGVEETPAPSEYDYAPVPVITSVTPAFADATGNSPITIDGSGFNILTFDWVDFGSPSSYASQDAELVSISPDEIEIDPAPAPSAVGTSPVALGGGITVVSLGGLSAAHRLDYAGVPKLVKLSSGGGPATGGRLLKLTGVGLQDVDDVVFAGVSGSPTVSSAQLKKVKSGSLEVVTPATLEGATLVEPCSQSGCFVPARSTAARAAASYVFTNPGPASLVSLSPTTGPAAGGTVVTVYGNNLDGARQVRFGKVAVAAKADGGFYPDGDPYLITAKAPAGKAGTTVAVSVVTATGAVVTAKGVVFAYR